MRIPAGVPKGQRAPRGSRGVLSLHKQADGSMVAHGWPKPRRGPLPLITEQQAATWDQALSLVKLADSQQRERAEALSAGSGFYARDVLIAACYGHMVSWPRWGVFYNGPTGPFQHITRRGVPSFPPREVGDPQPVNLAHDITTSNDGTTVTVTCKTVYPATVTLLRFCCVPDQIPVGTQRANKLERHGAKLWFACAPAEYDMDGAGDVQHSVSFTAADVGNACPNCALVFVEKGDQPLLDWCSLDLPCPTAPPNQGYWCYISASSVGPSPVILPPPIIAARDAVVDGEIACVLAAGGTVNSYAKGQVFDGCGDAFFVDGEFPGPGGNSCGVGQYRWKVTPPLPPACITPQVDRQALLWWIIFTVPA